MDGEKKVYLIWYKCDLRTALWGVCDNLETAKRIVDKINNYYGYEAKYTDEAIIED